MKKKVLFIAPHLSTGGMPQYLVKQVELIKNDCEVYCVEWGDVTGGVLVVQRNKMVKLLGDRLITLGEDKNELFTWINRIKPDTIHLQEIPELFMEAGVADKLYSVDREYTLIETSHDSGYDTKTKVYLPDKFLMVSQYQASMYKDFDIPCDVVEYPIENKVRTKTREQALTELGLDPNLKHVINVGLFTPRKNQAEVIEYARMLQNYPIQFHFIGNQADNFQFYWGPLMKDFPPNCKWWNERSDVDNFYEAADLFLFTSRGSTTDHETMPLVIRESLGWKVLSLIYNLPVYMGYFDKYDTIEYLTEDLQRNTQRIAEKVMFPKMEHHLTRPIETHYIQEEKPVLGEPMVINNELEELLKEKRLSFHNIQGGVNGLNGLNDMVQEHFKSDFKIVEIGSFEGKSTELFALHCAEVYAVDPYEQYDELSYEQLSTAENMFHAMRERRPNVKHIKKSSLDAVNDFEDESLDAVYIDGAHDYVNVKADILAWLPKIKPNGIICGHDYYGVVSGFGCPDIAQVVNEVFPNITPYTYGDSSWLIKKETPNKTLKEIFIISCFPNTREKENLLNKTVSQLKELNKEVLIASHYPVPQYIVEKANYYIYDAYNMVDTQNHTLDTDGPDFWVRSDHFYMESIITNHASALSRMFGIALDFVENLGYEFFTVMESDSIYDINDLKRLDTFKEEMLNENKEFIFFSPKFAEFAWQGERVYETYCYSGFVKSFQNIFKWPKTFDGWSALIKENKYHNCMEYLLKQKFKHLEHKALIKGTLKSEMLSSKIDLQTVSECSGVFYNENNPNEPILFLYNHDSLGRDTLYEINTDMFRFTVPLGHNGWWYRSMNFQGDNLTVKITTIRDGKTYSETVTTLAKNKLEELRKFKRMRFE